jgi:hypothetical protein
MALQPSENTDGKGRTTRTLSVRLPLSQALEIERQAKEKGYKNTNQYLVAMIGFIAPLTPSNLAEQVHLCQSNESAVADSAK